MRYFVTPISSIALSSSWRVLGSISIRSFATFVHLDTRLRVVEALRNLLELSVVANKVALDLVFAW
jgi:hypothetical protein